MEQPAQAPKRPLAGHLRQHRRWATIGLLALSYFAAAQISIFALGIGTAASPLWPPAGIALAALLLYGQHLWVGVAIGTFGVILAAQLPWTMALLLCWGSTLQAIVGYQLLHRRQLTQGRWQLIDLLLFIVLGVVVTPLVNALYSTVAGAFLGLVLPSDLIQNAALIWLGDGMGILVLTPVLLLGLPIRAASRSTASWLLELCLCLGLLIGASSAVFGSPTNSAIAQYPLEYLPFPFVVWAALRLGLRGTTLASALVSAIAVIGAVYRGGPFITKAAGNITEAILLLQGYVAVVTVTALVLAVVVSERRRSEAQLARSEASLANAQRLARLGNWDWHPPNPPTWSDELYALLGYAPHLTPPSRDRLHDRVHPEDRDRVRQTWNIALSQRLPYTLDYRLQLPNGHTCIVSEQVQIERDRLTGTLQDITQRKQAEAALRDSQTLRATLYRYMSQELAEQLLQNGTASLGGARRFVSVLFADIRSYTTLTEQLTPEATVDLLNAYFEAMVDVIFARQGTLDKFLGDGIMAVFGSPLPLPNHAVQAVLAALDMQQCLVKFNQHQQSRQQPQLQIGIGINSDYAITGNIGSSKRMEFTAIGDGVNLTARIESATKLYGCSLIISENTYRLCQDQVWARQLDYVRVKGKQQPVLVYEVLGSTSQPLSPARRRRIARYYQGRQHYQQRQFPDAIAIFKDLAPGDRAAQLHLERCQQLLQTPPPPDWDGSWQLN